MVFGKLWKSEQSKGLFGGDDKSPSILCMTVFVSVCVCVCVCVIDGGVWMHTCRICVFLCAGINNMALQGFGTKGMGWDEPSGFCTFTSLSC